MANFSKEELIIIQDLLSKEKHGMHPEDPEYKTVVKLNQRFKDAIKYNSNNIKITQEGNAIEKAIFTYGGSKQTVSIIETLSNGNYVIRTKANDQKIVHPTYITRIDA